jgi:hypothetical protein
MIEVAGKPHKFFEETLYPNNEKVFEFAQEWYEYVKNKNPDKAAAVNYKLNVDSDVMQELVESENTLSKDHFLSYDLLKVLSGLMKEACEYYNLDPQKERYYVHSWLNYSRGPRRINQEDIALDDHGAFPNRFHGYYAINAEPSITYYELDERNPDHPMGLWPVHNKNGRVLLSLSGYDHGIGDWLSSEPRITLAYNIIPQNMIPKDRKIAQHIPLII